MRYANFDLLGKTDDKEDSVEWLFYVFRRFLKSYAAGNCKIGRASCRERV